MVEFFSDQPKNTPRPFHPKPESAGLAGKSAWPMVSDADRDLIVPKTMKGFYGTGMMLMMRLVLVSRTMSKLHKLIAWSAITFDNAA
jgi:hypothetical protein